jgi:starvation-inducible DNA-binding protein
MNDLTISMKKLLANVFFYYYKAHAFHWNVESVLFSQIHGFLGDIYADAHTSVDDIAERIRIMDEYAPTNLAELYQLKTIQESNLTGNDVVNMLAELDRDNETIQQNLTEAFGMANSLNMQGLANYLAGRLEIHSKFGWMIKSHLK